MERRNGQLTPSDRLYLARACELAARALGSTSPNPAVGAVIVADGCTVGEGYHHRAGDPHAEVHALSTAGDRARGATLYVSLEPCNHHGRTGPCTEAVIDAGIARVVIGVADPNPKTDGGGIARLRGQGIAVDMADDSQAAALIERFAVAIRERRPFVTLKMASSLDGYCASKFGVMEWLTGEESRAYVRQQRIEHDAVMVGAGTVRVDDPQLTVRPAHRRLREYVRVVACESGGIHASAAVFAPVPEYAKTIVLAPAGLREEFEALRDAGDVLFVGSRADMKLDLRAALFDLRERGIHSVLCEGGPTVAGRLIADGLVDRFDWILAPRVLQNDAAVPVIAGADLATSAPGLHYDRVERLGNDMLLSGTFIRRV
ncbi:MAG: bifunctional diaminohydroxyphosphoribosylaminopyrimidine deaminase/5-amino-6-(5-phosphoribosylamino)uracil reductase RibD [Candidatus Eremiobacteraeota bacterium]|nr:bifunctional diaminohydroxyphosphoribosylaminopyrimidine deaminase/5-amino-6-(5-phosphoribosylamino)uracil reductase RibD [Candidatus Eremiobacteraeota bacterium]